MAKQPVKKATRKPTEKVEKKFTTGETLANRHRPRTWDDICGHNKQVARLKGMIAKGEIPNAILFTGPSGTGKTTLARVFARYLNCETNDGCGECPSCKAMDSRRHPDYQEINCADARGIDEIRSVLQQAKFMPQMGELRIIVLDEAQQITGPGVQAMLKSLEEPPAHTLFIICTMEPEKLHAAVVGRCQLMELKRVGAEYVAEHLKVIAEREGIEGLDEKAFELIAESTGGQLRNALQTLDAVAQVMAGVDADMEGDELDEMIRSAVVDASGVSDDNAASKALLYVHAGKIGNKSTIRGVLKCVLDVQNPVAFANALLWQNSYLIDTAVDPKSPGIYHTATNRNLVKLLDEKVEHTEKYGSKPKLSIAIAVHQHLLKLRTELVQISGQDKALMQIHLSNAWQAAAEFQE